MSRHAYCKCVGVCCWSLIYGTWMVAIMLTLRLNRHRVTCPNYTRTVIVKRNSGLIGIVVKCETSAVVRRESVGLLVL